MAHASEPLIRDVLEVSSRPVVVSHTGPEGLCGDQRGMSDDLMLRVAGGGGLIGIGFWPHAVCGKTVPDIVNAIDYAVRLVGVDHVALGSDFDGAVTTPFDSRGMPLLTEALLDGGRSEEDIAKIMGGNTLRLLEQLLPSTADDTSGSSSSNPGPE